MHTQGPWTAKTRKVGSHVTGPDGFAVAQVGTEANARLIAAAPEMLSALQQAVALMDDEQAKPWMVRKVLELAIAKAGG